MLGMSRIAVFFQWFVVPDVRKVGSLKRRVQRYIAVQQRNEKWHAAVARSTFATQNAQNTSVRDQFLMWRSRKMARRCGAKHICNSKCTKHLSMGPIFDVTISKKGHAAVARSTFATQNAQNTSVRDPFLMWRSRKKGHAAVARSTFATQNAQNTSVWDQFLMWGSRKKARRCGVKHICNSKCRKKTSVRDPFLMWRSRKKGHAAVARSTFATQNAQNTSVWDQFLMWGSRKKARRCGVKHICNSKCTKDLSAGPIFDVTISKKGHAAVVRSTCATQNAQNTSVRDQFLMWRSRKKGKPLWREAHVSVHMCKTPAFWHTFGPSDVEKVLAS